MTDAEQAAVVEAAAISPVRQIRGDKGRKPQSGLAVCLSGGGYRAMLFHVGVLWRLNEVGMLREVKRFSSVSGGSITAGVLAMNWDRMTFGHDNVASNFGELVVTPLRRWPASLSTYPRR
jgi:NTE family protein